MRISAKKQKELIDSIDWDQVEETAWVLVQQGQDAQTRPHVPDSAAASGESSAVAAAALSYPRSAAIFALVDVSAKPALRGLRSRTAPTGALYL